MKAYTEDKNMLPSIVSPEPAIKLKRKVEFQKDSQITLTLPSIEERPSYSDVGKTPLEEEEEDLHLSDLSVSISFNHPLSLEDIQLITGTSPDPDEEKKKKEHKMPEDEEMNLLKKQLIPLAMTTGNKPVVHSNRFKTIAQKIKANLVWTRTLVEKDTEDEGFTVNKQEANALTFNINDYRTNNNSYGGLSLKTKLILQKNAHERTDDDLQILEDVVGRLKCFEKYSRTVKRECARVMSYECYEDSRIIIKQGHTGISFYFIVSGAVTVKTKETDKTSGRQHTVVLGVLSEGSHFGELALLHNIKRTATIVCKGTSEFLRIDKPDFDHVLKLSYEHEWKERMSALRWCPYLREWSKESLICVNKQCKIEEYQPDQVIIGNKVRAPEYVHFIIFGEVRVVKRMVLLRENIAMSSREKKYTLASEEEAAILCPSFHGDSPPVPARYRRSRPIFLKIPELKYLTVCTLAKGHYFGAGENLKDTYMVSRDKVSILKIPRVQFYKYGHSKLLTTLKDDLDYILPGKPETFRNYVNAVKWMKYKKRVIRDVIRKRSIPNTTTLQDVPDVLKQDAGMA